MRIAKLLSRLLSPPVCFSCGDRLPLFYEGILCPECKSEIEERSERECDRCENPIAFCHCSKKVLYARSCRRHVKLLRYDPKRRDLHVNRLIYSMKEKADRELYDFIAELMEGSLTAALISERVENKLERVIVTYVPRSRHSVRRLGFDQARLLAEAVARKLNIPCMALVKRARYRDKTMKSLHFLERFENAGGAFVYSGKEPISEKTLVLICDDVITTGASVCAVIDCLGQNGAEHFVAVSVGVTSSEEEEKEKIIKNKSKEGVLNE